MYPPQANIRCRHQQVGNVRLRSIALLLPCHAISYLAAGPVAVVEKFHHVRPRDGLRLWLYVGKAAHARDETVAMALERSKYEETRIHAELAGDDAQDVKTFAVLLRCT